MLEAVTGGQRKGPCLVSGSGPDEVTIDLSTGVVWAVGRSKKSDIVLDDEMASRNHALIQRTRDEFRLVDLGSQNGAFVNGQRVSVPVHLKDQDKITFGYKEFIFVHAPGASGPEPQPEGLRRRSRAESWSLTDSRGISPLSVMSSAARSDSRASAQGLATVSP